jgi:hypothetical protein
MISPIGRLEELKVSPKSNYRCFELSPNGLLYAAVTVSSVEIWSACGETSLLAKRNQQRPSGYSKALLNRIFLVWNDTSDAFIVIRSEGIADFYMVSTQLTSLEDVYYDQDSALYYAKASLKLCCSVNIEQFGYPISACAVDSRIFVLSDNGVLGELNWKGDQVGQSFSRFVQQTIAEALPGCEKKTIECIASSPELHCLAVALSDGNCLLLDISQSPVGVSTFRTTLTEGVRHMRFCSGLPALAVTSARMTVDIFLVKWSPSLAAHLLTSIDVRQFPSTASAPLFTYDAIVSLSWCPRQLVLALGLRYQGLIVWSFSSGVLFSFRNKLALSDDSARDEAHCSGIVETSEVSCCCFTQTGACLLFNVPFQQVTSGADQQTYSRDSRLLVQHFVVTSDATVAT